MIHFIFWLCCLRLQHIVLLAFSATKGMSSRNGWNHDGHHKRFQFCSITISGVLDVCSSWMQPEVFVHLEEGGDSHNFLPLKKYLSACRRSLLMAMKHFTAASPGFLSPVDLDCAGFHNEEQTLQRGAEDLRTLLFLWNIMLPQIGCCLPVKKHKKMEEKSGWLWLNLNQFVRLISCPATVLILASTGLSSLQPLKR